MSDDGKETISAEDFGVKKMWNNPVHKVDLIVHTTLGTIKMTTQYMSNAQLDEFRGSLRSKLNNPHGTVEMTMEDGIIFIPHELLVSSVVQIGIDVKNKPPEEETKTEEKPKKRKPRKAPPIPDIPDPEQTI